jgi:hypothetical protein
MPSYASEIVGLGLYHTLAREAASVVADHERALVEHLHTQLATTPSPPPDWGYPDPLSTMSLCALDARWR